MIKLSTLIPCFNKVYYNNKSVEDFESKSFDKK